MKVHHPTMGVNSSFGYGGQLAACFSFAPNESRPPAALLDIKL